ncbi:MAG: serpin family protein [Prevotella sp.]|nr:serpin family protein [Prevotella sp.]MBR3414312.1 serpin family protein [Bacteroidales bacterium]MBR3479464.1 serpin family protein [Prevotella sp.]MBR6187438.1 serpin family protein [Prevotella sp.]MBR6190485.1 serpin family protein [Prevotella sp.]
MKKNILLMSLLLMTISAAAYENRRPMLVQGKTWWYICHHVDYAENSESAWEVSYRLQGDTVIEGRQYMKMYREDRFGRKYHGALREDEDGRVWQYDYEGDKKDFMLCDYTCLHYPGSWPEVGDVVDVVKVFGKLLHRHSWNGMLGVEGVGMEGKGLVHYLFEPVLDPNPNGSYEEEKFAFVQGDGVYFTAADFSAPKYIELTQDEKQLVKQNNDFAFRLFSTARSIEPSSMILSPLSITYALGMLNNGAAGQTQQEISKVLGFGDVDAQNEFCQKMKLELAGTAWYDPTRLNIANTIFVNKGMGWQVKDDFAQKASQYYMANPQNRDFRDGETRDVINQWASDHTEGMIKEVLSEPEFNPRAVSYLLNAIYFKGMWSNPFEAENTREESFNGGDAVPMMNKQEMLAYTENDVFQEVVLPYGSGSYQMQVFLPRVGKTIDNVLENLASDNSLLTSNLPSYEVDLKLPRFETNTNIGLKNIMSELGMPTAFDPYNADFSNLCVENFDQNIYIGLMKQVAKIEVNEQGTEAAAVTIIGEYTSGIPETATFYANRPFLYVIREQSTGIIIFMGQYTGNTSFVDGISATLNDKGEMINEKCYDLQGRQLSNSKWSNNQIKKGIYIINGKKIIR